MRTIAAWLLLAAAGFALVSGVSLASDNQPPKNQHSQIKQTQNQPPKPETNAQTDQPIKHVVGNGESLSSIAADNHLSSWRELWNCNLELQNPDQLGVGQEITIPTGPTTDRPLPPGYGGPVVAAPVVTTSRPGVAYRVSAPAPASGDLFARIRSRESGGNYAENTGNGYYGAYQFSLGTWQSVGGTGNPASASPAEQDMRAQMLYARRGCSPWPQTCH